MFHKLYTPQGEALQSTPWQSHPHPQMKRECWLNLNGNWDFAVTAREELPEAYDKTILVPFCPESLLSGLELTVAPGSWLHYRRSFALSPEFAGKRVLLHIGAADQRAEVFVNGQSVGGHVGGYNSFTLDITDALNAEENTLQIRVFDDLRDQTLPYGKQSLNRGGMWYTPVSGIWQTVWLEAVPEAYIRRLYIHTDMTCATITIDPPREGKVLLEGKEYPLAEGSVVIAPENPRLWSPEVPNLYQFSLVTDTDRVDSYFALRQIDTRTVKGIPRLCLNGKPYFFNGLLDQGYWSDGIYTPAQESCYTQDILEMKKLGFNTLRKHIKVEPEQFYYECDRLGMVVFQDMVNNSDYRFFRDTALPTVGIQKLPDKTLHPDPVSRNAFLGAMAETVRQLQNHPCILYWTIFNEGWGQFCSDDAYEMLRGLDSSRIIDSTSGWFRRKQSDVDSRHLYVGSWNQLQPNKDTPLVLSEFGGYAYPVEGHLFNTENAYGYKSCKSLEHFQKSVENLYLDKVLPAAKRGICAAICTQVSDVEDEINGFLTYDRKVNKADPAAMVRIARLLQAAVE